MNAARHALTNAVNRAIAAGSPVAVNVPVDSRMNLSMARRLKRCDEVYWNDPDGGLCSGFWKIAAIRIEGDMLTIEDLEGGVLQCRVYELDPFYITADE